MLLFLYRFVKSSDIVHTWQYKENLKIVKTFHTLYTSLFKRAIQFQNLLYYKITPIINEMKTGNLSAQ